MNARVKKEVRSLWSSFGMAILAVAALASLLNGRDAVGFVLVLFIGFCGLIGASAFGSEMDARTMLSLLAQPVSRRQLWYEKMRVLAVALGLIYAVTLGCVLVMHEGMLVHPYILWPTAASLFLVVVAAFCTSPFLTLMTRNLIGGAVFSYLLPFSLSAIFFFICWGAALFTSHPDVPFLQSKFEQHPYWAIGIPAAVYCAVCYWLGYRAFMNFQVIDSQSRELRLPDSWESALARPLRMILPGHSGPVASLFRKELQVQKINFLVAGFVGVTLLCETAIWKLHHSDYILYWMLAEWFLYTLAIPLLAGTVAFAEERSWGTVAWQLTLPVPALKQWVIKILTALVTVVLLGIALPVIFILLARWFGLATVNGSDSPSLPNWNFSDVTLVATCYFLVFSAVLFASSASTNSIRALLLFCGLLVGCGLIMGALDYLGGDGFLNRTPGDEICSVGVLFCWCRLC